VPAPFDTEVGLAGLGVVIAITSFLLMRWTSKRPRLRLLSWLFLYTFGGALFLVGMMVFALLFIHVIGIPSGGEPQ
jgi:predicted MFS family arabinose efflux permease